MSLWGEIRDRVNGETVRKEEELYEEENLWSSAEGFGSIASGLNSYAEGYASVAEGIETLKKENVKLSKSLDDLRKELNKYTWDNRKYKKELCGKYRKHGGW